MERVRGERGQAAGEYAALLALVAIVFAALVGLTSGGLGWSVLAGMQRGLCAIAPGPCPRWIAPRADLAACPVERSARREELSETIAVVRLASSGMLRATRSSDGRVTITLADGSGVGAEIGVGARVETGASGSGARARLLRGLVWGSGRSWTFPDGIAAQRFVERYGDKATMRGKLVDQVRSRCSLLCDAIGWEPHAELPEPDEVFVEGGAAASLAGSFGLAGMRVDGKAEAGAVLGRRIARGGETTWYVQLSADAAASMRLPVGSLGAAAGANALLAYTLDSAGRPLRLGVEWSGAASGSALLELERRRGKAGGSGTRGGVVELEATLDLADAGNRAAARDVLDVLAHPTRWGSAPAPVAALAQRIASHGQLDERLYLTRSERSEVGGSLALGVGIGAALGRSSEGLELVHAATRLPGLPFLPRDDCRSA